MGKLNDKTIRNAIGLKEDLEYMIDRFKTDGLGYVKIEDLEKAKDEVTKDINEYQKTLVTSCPALSVGAIIRISCGDGVSYSQRDYYKITKITDSHLHFDLVTVVHGDYGNEIKVDRNSKDRKEDWIKRYNRNYHKDDISEDEWNELLGYAEKVPWPKES
jgi:phosphoribosylformimino-5-aminoimidazole carboxamide ribonucleotide (ProFAR) isomerase